MAATLCSRVNSSRKWARPQPESRGALAVLQEAHQTLSQRLGVTPGTSTPSWVPRISRTGGMSEATTGTPSAIASITAPGIPS